MVRTATENSYIYLNIYKRAAIRTNPHAWPQARVGFNLLLPLLQLLLFISRWKIFPFQNWIHLLRMEETSIGFGFVLHDLFALIHAKLYRLYSSKKKKKNSFYLLKNCLIFCQSQIWWIYFPKERGLPM